MSLEREIVAKESLTHIDSSPANTINTSDKMNVTYDEYGRPFIILREQANKSRVKGLEAQKVRKFVDKHTLPPFVVWWRGEA